MQGEALAREGVDACVKEEAVDKTVIPNMKLEFSLKPLLSIDEDDNQGSHFMPTVVHEAQPREIETVIKHVATSGVSTAIAPSDGHKG